MELTLTAAEVGYLIEVLNGRPYTEVAALIPKIVKQVQEQVQQQKVPVDKPLTLADLPE